MIIRTVFVHLLRKLFGHPRADVILGQLVYALEVIIVILLLNHGVDSGEQPHLSKIFLGFELFTEAIKLSEYAQKLTWMLNVT